MIRIRLKKKFETEEEAWRYLLTIVTPGDENYFEATGKQKKKCERDYLKDDLKALGLEPTE